MTSEPTATYQELAGVLSVSLAFEIEESLSKSGLGSFLD